MWLTASFHQTLQVCPDMENIVLAINTKKKLQNKWEYELLCLSIRNSVKCQEQQAYQSTKC